MSMTDRPDDPVVGPLPVQVHSAFDHDLAAYPCGVCWPKALCGLTALLPRQSLIPRSTRPWDAIP